MSEYTPSTNAVRDAYAGDRHRNVGTVPAYEEFDRWLAEEERAAAEKAWHEGCNAGLREWNDHSRGGVNNPVLNPHRKDKTDD